MAKINLAEYQYSLSLQDNDFSNKMNNADAKTGKFKGSIGGLTTFLKASVAAFAVVGGAIIGLAAKTSQYADEIDKLSERTGIGVENLQKWKYAAGQSGADISVLETGIKKLSGSMDDAINGNKDAINSFHQLGISVDDLKNKTQEEIFDKMMLSLADMEKGAQRNALGNDLLGKSYTELLPLLNAGSEGMNDLKNRASELGLVMSEDTINAGVLLGDTMDDVKASFGALGMGIGAEVLPVLQTMLEWVLSHMPEIQQFFSTAFDVIGTVISTGIEWVRTFIGWVKQWYIDNKETIDMITTAFSEFFTAIGDLIAATIQVLKDIWSLWGDDMEGITDTKMALIKDTFTFWMDSITGTIKAATALMQGDWESFFDIINDNTAKQIINGKKLFDSFFDYAEERHEKSKERTLKILKSIGDFFSSEWARMLEIVTINANAILAVIDNLVDRAESAVNKVTSSINKIPGINIPSLNIPDIPKFAEGGNFIGTGSFISGEEGAELVNLSNKGARITPLTNKQKKSFDGTGDNSRETIITGNNFYIREDADIGKVARELFQIQRKSDRGQAFA